MCLWKDNKYWQRAYGDIFGRINNHHPKNNKIEFIKKPIVSFLTLFGKKKISGVPTFITDTNKPGKWEYKSEELSKVI